MGRGELNTFSLNLKTTFKVYGKRQILILSQPETPKPIVTKFECRDYVVNAYHQKEFGLNQHMFFSAHISEIYTLPVRNLLHFLVLQLAYRQVCWTDFYA